MGWPQMIYIGLGLIGFGVVLAKHGQPREPYNIWSSLFGTALVIGLLVWGGFFS